jgi:RimJ/RimL family protein N-acetyltransferase
MTAHVELREVRESDLSIFFEQQLDPEANRMAAFTALNPADRDAFTEKWLRITGDPSITSRAILVDGVVAGSVQCHSWFGTPEVCYWIGREFWGRGIASMALRQFLEIVTDRPLQAYIAHDNIGSRRVLEKCGFQVSGDSRQFSHARAEEVDQLVLALE